MPSLCRNSSRLSSQMASRSLSARYLSYRVHRPSFSDLIDLNRQTTSGASVSYVQSVARHSEQAISRRPVSPRELACSRGQTLIVMQTKSTTQITLLVPSALPYSARTTVTMNTTTKSTATSITRPAVQPAAHLVTQPFSNNTLKSTATRVTRPTTQSAT